MGICLGSQLLARACGAEVKKCASPEIGWRSVKLTPEGERDPLFSGLSPEPEVFQWHEDTFDLPPGGVLLAEGSHCRNQAFRAGKNAYGFQFHMEVTPEMIGSWIAEYGRNSIPEAQAKCMLEESRARNEDFVRQAGIICRNFAQLIGRNN